MPSKRPPLVSGEIYHVVIRAIEGLKLFRDEKDYYRMVHDLFEFNDEAPVSSYYREVRVNQTRTLLVGLEKSQIKNNKIKRKLLVEILAFCLMPNHIHLLTRQLVGGGISKLMRKLGAGYGGYYNKRYKRSGHLFGGRYRLVHIESDKQLMTVFVYVHTNPVAIIVPGWKEKGIKSRDFQKASKFLEEYRWSSYPDYLENKNFPSLTNRESLTEMMGGAQGCQKFVNDWLQFKKELADFDQVVID
ncbi:MAG: transposase [bacterium]|nr:transposase [bacterium]